MSCFRKSENRSNSLLVSHLSYHNNIWVFSHSITDCLLKSRNISSNLFLMYETLIIFYYIFNRILNHNNMLMLILVEIINHSNDRGCFTASCSSSYQYKSTIFIQKFQEIFIQSNIFSWWCNFLDSTHSNSNTIIIFGYIRTKSSSFILIHKTDPRRNCLYFILIYEGIHKYHKRNYVIIWNNAKFFYRSHFTIGGTHIRKIATSNMDICNCIFNNYIDKFAKFIFQDLIHNSCIEKILAIYDYSIIMTLLNQIMTGFQIQILDSINSPKRCSASKVIPYLFLE